jgi:hypothetical protein
VGPRARAAGLAAVLCLGAGAGPAAAKKNGPAAPDLRGLITCDRTNADWMAFATAYGQPGAAAAWGWRKTPLGTGLLEAYALKEPVSVFGEKVTKIAFSGSGVVAVLAEGALPRLVRELKLQPFVNGATAKVFGHEVRSTVDKAGDTTIVAKVSLSASTSADYPGVVLAGCSYTVEVR